MVVHHHHGICNTTYALGKTNTKQHKGSSSESEQNQINNNHMTTALMFDWLLLLHKLKKIWHVCVIAALNIHRLTWSTLIG